MQPFPYHWFIITVIISVAGLTGFVLLDWRKTGRLRDILQFVSHPVEDCFIDLNIRSILMTLLWYLIIQYFFNFSYAGFIDRALFDAPFPKNNISDASSAFPSMVHPAMPSVAGRNRFQASAETETHPHHYLRNHHCIHTLCRNILNASLQRYMAPGCSLHRDSIAFLECGI